MKKKNATGNRPRRKITRAEKKKRNKARDTEDIYAKMRLGNRSYRKTLSNYR